MISGEVPGVSHFPTSELGIPVPLSFSFGVCGLFAKFGSKLRWTWRAVDLRALQAFSGDRSVERLVCERAEVRDLAPMFFPSFGRLLVVKRVKVRAYLRIH